MPKNITPNLAALHAGDEIGRVAPTVKPVSAICASLTGWSLIIARRIVISSKSLPGPNLQEDVGRFDALGFANVDQHHRAILATARQELALLHQRVLGEVPRMALRRIASPVHDEIGSVLDFAERAGDLTAQLGGYFSGTMSQRGVAVEQAHRADRPSRRILAGLRKSYCSSRRPAACRRCKDDRRPLRSPRRPSLLCPSIKASGYLCSAV